MYHGVYTIAGDPGELNVRALAALKLTGPLGLVCETTALALHGTDLPHSRLSETVHVWVPRGAVDPQTPGIHVHQNALHRPPRLTALAVRTAHPAECWFQAARSASVHDLVVLADGLMRRRQPLLGLRELHDVVAGAGGQRGVVKARVALDLARPGTDSPMETRTRLILVEAGLPCPAVNHPWHNAWGYAEYLLDMAYEEAKLAVEYDGADHADVVQMRKDRTRRRRIEDSGWRIITATAADIDNPGPLVASVSRALATRGAPGGRDLAFRP